MSSWRAVDLLGFMDESGRPAPGEVYAWALLVTSRRHLATISSIVSGMYSRATCNKGPIYRRGRRRDPRVKAKHVSTVDWLKLPTLLSAIRAGVYWGYYEPDSGAAIDAYRAKGEAIHSDTMRLLDLLRPDEVAHPLVKLTRHCTSCLIKGSPLLFDAYSTGARGFAEDLESQRIFPKLELSVDRTSAPTKFGGRRMADFNKSIQFIWRSWLYAKLAQAIPEKQRDPRLIFGLIKDDIRVLTTTDRLAPGLFLADCLGYLLRNSVRMDKDAPDVDWRELRKELEFKVPRSA